MISHCLNDGCLIEVSKLLSIISAYDNYISYSINQICSGHNCPVIPVSPQFPDDCALPPPHHHGSLPKDYHLVSQIPIHPLLASHTLCYLPELVLHHSSIPLPTFPFQSASMWSRNPPHSSAPYYFSVIWHFVISYY